MDTDRLTAFTVKLNALLERRTQLMERRDATQEPGEDRVLSTSIKEVNEKLLPALRKRVHAAYNAAKGNEKHQLSELIGKVDGELSGIGTFRDLDPSEARLNSLRRRQGLTKSHREAKQIAMEIREIERARAQLAKQEQAIAQEEMRRKEKRI